MKTSFQILLMIITTLIVTSACGLPESLASEVEKIPSMAADTATQVMTTLEAQMEILPTIEAQVQEMPTKAAEAQQAFTDFNGVPDEVMQRIFDRTLTLTSYRMDVTVKQGDEVTSTMNYEVIPPDRIHALIDSQGSITEQYIIGSDAYMKLGDEWMKLPVEMENVYGLAIEQTRNLITDVALVGPDTLDGAPMMVFTYSLNMHNIETKNKVWVGVLDGYIHQVEGVSMIEGKEYHTLSEVYDFNEPLTIKAPIQ